MGKIYVVGIGAGKLEMMTKQAINALNLCDIIIGYTVYVDLIKQHFQWKNFITTPMRQERKRCEMAFYEASLGKVVAMICSGDAGVYGMAGLILEIGKNYNNIDVEVISGVTAALSGAALLGAPLIHDFAVISLSDLLTPWEKIEKRLRYAVIADFVICIYNPSSKKRKDYLKRACEILLSLASPNTICGIARNIGRDKEEKYIMTLSELKNFEVDMFTTVFIGNSQTKKIGNNMVTPRGYL